MAKEKTGFEALAAGLAVDEVPPVDMSHPNVVVPKGVKLFGDGEWESPSKGLRDWIRAAELWCLDWQLCENRWEVDADGREVGGPYWLTLAGAPGRGKTTIAKAAVKWMDGQVIWTHDGEEWRKERRDSWRKERYGAVDGRGVYVTTAGKLTEVSEDGKAALKAARDCRVLLLDDLMQNAVTASGYGDSVIGDLLDSRLGRWTILTTNKKMVEIMGRDERMGTRLTRGGSCFLWREMPLWQSRPRLEGRL